MTKRLTFTYIYIWNLYYRDKSALVGRWNCGKVHGDTKTGQIEKKILSFGSNSNRSLCRNHLLELLTKKNKLNWIFNWLYKLEFLIPIHLRN